MEPVCALAEMGGHAPAWEVDPGCYRGSPHRMAEDRTCNYFFAAEAREGVADPLSRQPVRLLHVGHLAVREDNLHVVVVIDDLRTHIGHTYRRAKNRLHLVGGLAQVNGFGSSGPAIL